MWEGRNQQCIEHYYYYDIPSTLCAASSYMRHRFKSILTDSFSSYLVAVRVQVYEKGSLQLSRIYE